MVGLLAASPPIDVEDDATMRVVATDGTLWNAAAAALVDGHLVAAYGGGLRVYDVTEPLAPRHVGDLELTTEPVLVTEDLPAAGGLILMKQAAEGDVPVLTTDLVVVDASSLPQLAVAAIVPISAHNWACVADCAFAYGTEGQVVDLRDPAAPVVLDVDWLDGLYSTHDVAEIAPGLLAFSGGFTHGLVDVTDPTAPVVLGHGLAERSAQQFGTSDVHGLRDDERQLVFTGEATMQTDRGCGDFGVNVFEVAGTAEEFGPLRATGRWDPGARHPQATSTWVDCLTHVGLSPTTTVDGGPVAVAAGDLGVYLLAWTGEELVEVAHTVGSLPEANLHRQAIWVTDDVLHVVSQRGGLEVLLIER